MQRTLALSLLVAGGLVFTACDDNQLTGFEDQMLAKRSAPRGNSSSVVVMTHNLYVGADVDPIVYAALSGDEEALAAAIADAIATLGYTYYPDRAFAIAQEINAFQPHLIGLQEVSVIQVPGVTLDFLDILEQVMSLIPGLDYEVAGSVENFNVTLPLGEGQFAQLIDYDVVLRRGDVYVDPASVVEQTYDAFISAGPITLSRGFVALNATVDGQTFRFVSTHPESGSEPPIFAETRVAQIQQLIEILSEETLPVVLVGDLNSNAVGAGMPGYNMLRHAGYKDAWLRSSNSGEEGLTCCHLKDLSNESVDFSQRIDLILASKLGWADVWIVGDRFESSLGHYLWPSDHAGVVGRLHIPLPAVTVDR